MPVTGLEPVRYRYRRILSPLRLPIPSHRQMQNILYNTNQKKSSCIFKFSIEVFNELGLLLDNSEAKRHLSALTKELQQTACLSALSSLADNEESGILKTALQSYKEKGYLSPKQASVVFWRLKEHNIEYNPSFFKISLGRTKYKQDLAAMDSWRVYVFWDALTSDQRKIAQSLGHKVPATSTR